MNKRNLILIVITVLVIGTTAYFGFNMNNKDTADKDNISDIVQNTEVQDGEDNELEETQQYIIDIGEEAPDFTLEDLEGNEVSLKDYRGKIVLVNFWATWCPPCRKEMPDLDKIYLENKDDDFVVLAVNGGEAAKDVKKFIDDNGYSFPVLLDKDVSVGMNYNVAFIPTSFMVNKEGKISAIKSGIMSYAEAKEMLEHVKGL